jgi:hypothetical protein
VTQLARCRRPTRMIACIRGCSKSRHHQACPRRWARTTALQKVAPPGSRLSTLMICVMDTVEEKNGEEVFVQDGMMVMGTEGSMQSIAQALLGRTVPLSQLSAEDRVVIANFTDIMRWLHRNGVPPGPQPPEKRKVSNRRRTLATTRDMLRLEFNATNGECLSCMRVHACVCMHASACWSSTRPTLSACHAADACVCACI